MAGSTYSSNLKIELMTTGENSGTWGDVTNTNLGTALEQAVVGYGNPDYASDANLTISITNSNASQAARCLVLNVTSTFGSLTATRELVVPTIQKQYIVQNNTTGGQSITVKTSAGTGITVPNGRKAHLYVNGTDVIQMFDYVDINGGTIDGTAIGGSSASTGAFTTLNASGATTLDGNVTLGNASGDTVTVTGTIASNLLFTDNTYDIGASGATRPRNLYLAGAATIGGNLSVGGTLTLTGGLILNGNVTVGDSAADTLTVNATITSNLLFTDNTYDIGASGATRPRNLFLAGNATIGGSQTLTGSLTVDSTTDSSSTTTGSIQTDGGLGVAKALYVGTTANIAGDVTLSGGTANGVTYLNGSKVLTSGSALTFNGSNIFTVVPATGTAYNRTESAQYSTWLQTGAGNANVFWEFSAGTPVRWVDTSAGELMRLTSTGLGIGGVSSGKILSIQASDTTNAVNGQAGLQIINTNASAGGRMTTVTFGGRSSSNYPFAAIAGILVSDSAQEQSGDLAFYTKSTTTAANPTERARIYSDGNMALGYSSTSINGFTVGNYSYTTAYAADLGANAADFGYGSSLNVWSQSDTATISGITLATRSTGRSRWDILNVWTNSYLGDLVLRYRSGGTSTAEAMRITSSGIVGIGTNSPGTYSTKFSINGNSTARMMNIDNAGANGVNVGFSNNGTDVGFLGSAKWVTNGTLTDFAIGSVNSLIFSQNGNERARIDGSGRLLVNTNSAIYTNSKIQATASSGPTLGIQQTTNSEYVAGFWNSSSTTVRKLVAFFNGTTGTQHGSIESTGTTMLYYGAGGNGISIDSSGNVGIGNTSPSGRLDVTGRTYIRASGSDTVLTLINQSGGDGSISATGTSSTMNYGFSTFSKGNALYIQNNGFIGINNNAPNAMLEVRYPFSASATTLGDVSQSSLYLSGAGYTNQYVQIAFGYDSIYAPAVIAFTPTVASGNTYGDILFATRSVTTATAPTERMRILSNGRVLIGYSSSQQSANLQVYQADSATQQPAAIWNGVNWSSGTSWLLSFAVGSSYSEKGYIGYNGTSVAITQISDVRYKKNIVDAPSAMSKIDAIRIRSFDFKEDDRHVEFGVVAQELNDVLPSAVFEGADNADGSVNKPWAVNLEPVIPVLVKAFQELKAEFDAYKASHP